MDFKGKKTYLCQYCHDTGFILGQSYAIDVYGENSPPVDMACKCPHCNGGQKIKKENIKSFSDIPAAFYNSDLSNFKPEVYKKDGQDIDISVQMSLVTDMFENFKDYEESGFGLYIYSSTKGSGKTYLASCLANSLIAKYSIRCKFVSASDLIDISGNKEDFAKLIGIRLLIIDDIGVKAQNDWYEEVLFKIVDKRMQNKKMTIYTSNIKIMELPYSDRIRDRIYKTSNTMTLPEICVRLQESNDKKREFLRKRGLIK